ncbi:hypothetical protein ACQR3P_28505 [Rhodococcus sp. IEGM1300]
MDEIVNDVDDKVSDAYQKKSHAYSLILDTFDLLLKDKSFVDSQTVNAITRIKAKRAWLVENKDSIIETYTADQYLSIFNNLMDQDGLLYAYQILLDLMMQRNTKFINSEMYNRLAELMSASYAALGTTPELFKLTSRVQSFSVGASAEGEKPFITPEGLNNNSYSGTDMVATIQLPGGKAMILGELASVNYSVYREKTLVRALGYVRPKGVTRGQRTISGILEFTNFDSSVAYKVLSEYYEMGYHVLMDELPQFDITLTMANESGQRSVFRIYGISTFTEGSMMSIDQLTTRSSYEFYAMDIDPMAPLQYKSNIRLGVTGDA